MKNKNGQIKDLTGQKFGRLTVVSFAYRNNKGTFWNCLCDCKNEKVVKGKYLVAGETKSCGCWRKERTKSIETKFKLTTSGIPSFFKYKTKLYHILKAMIHRCYNIENKHYQWYGAKGIEICDEWKNEEKGFYNFYYWAMDHGYKEGLSIDRLDVEGNYEPNNCAWKDRIEQCNNMTTNVLIEYNGQRRTSSMWASICDTGVSTEQIRGRWQRGVRGDDLFIIKDKIPLEEQLININGIHKTIDEWIQYYNISYSKFIKNYKKGLRDNELIESFNLVKNPKKQHTYNTYIIINNESLSLKEAASKYDIKLETIRNRYNRGLRGGELISKQNLHKTDKN